MISALNRISLSRSTAARGRLIFYLAATAIVVLAAALRLYALDFADVRFDEASALQQALSIAQGRLQLLAHFSGSLLNHGPAYLYLMALPYLATRDFLAVLAWRALLDVLAIALCMAVCRRHFSARMALATGLLFATAPWAIQFSRNTGIVVIPLLGTLVVLGLLEAINKRHDWGWALAFAGASLAVASHWSGIYWLIVCAICAVVWRRAFSFRHGLMGLAVLLVFGAGYLAGDAAKGFENVRGFMSRGTADTVAPSINLQTLNVALWSSGGAHISDLTGPAYSLWVAQTPSLMGIIDGAQQALLIAGVATAIALGVILRKRVEGRLANGAAVLAIGWCVPVLLQMIGTRPVAMHYLLPLYPLPFMLMGLALDQGLSLMNTRLHGAARNSARIAWALVPLVIAGAQAFTWLRFIDFAQAHNTSPGGYGAPARSLIQAGQLASSAMREGLDEVIVVIQGDTQPWREAPVVADAVLSGVPHRFLNAESGGLIFRAQGTHYIIAPGAEDVVNRIEVIYGNTVITQALPVRGDGSQAGYTYARAGPFDQSRFQPQAATWQSGIALAGARHSLAGARMEFQALMQVMTAPAKGSNFHWFNHVYAAGDKIAQADGQGVHPFYWRAGDLIVMDWRIDLPDANPPLPLVMRMGCYTYPEPQRVPVTLSYGKEADEVDVTLEE